MSGAICPRAEAIPLYARQYNLRCNACHIVPPKLNVEGTAFLARGYRMPPDYEGEKIDTIPVAVWLTGRHENQQGKGFSKSSFPKVEFISGGPIADDLSYFVEWRTVSKQTRSDGTLLDRSGRFEDAFIDWQFDERGSLMLGQYRSLNQVDVSRRLSISEPAIFSASLAGKPASNPRIESLRAFSPAGRSPGVTLALNSIHGNRPSDGLFHFVTVPFPGEFSIPLTSEARREASFEMRGEPKGVFLETFYQQDLNTIGLHSFIGNRTWLVTALGTLNIDKLHLTGGIGVDDPRDGTPRVRSSLEVEYFFLRDMDDFLRAGAGFRVEHISNTDTQPAYIPYLAISSPNAHYTFLLQMEFRAQKDNEGFFIDLSLIF